MILALDVGSATLFGGLLDEGRVLASFHKSTVQPLTADELGLFLLNWMDARDFSSDSLEGLVYCSVIPEWNPVVSQCAGDYFGVEALTLKAGVKSGIRVKYSNHNDLGGDLLANAAAALKLYPDRNLLIVDFGTATSLCAVSDQAEYLGGTLVPGMDISMEALAERTARLPEVEITPVQQVCGRDMVSSIQGGLYWGTLGMLKELIFRMGRECFPDAPPEVVATGHHASLFEKFDCFDHVVPELVLLGLEQIRQLNLD